MFGIANAIAYAGRMVAATEAGPSPIRDMLGASAWIDVDAPSLDKWVEAEGVLIAAAIARLAAVGGCPGGAAGPLRHLPVQAAVAAAAGAAGADAGGAGGT